MEQMEQLPPRTAQDQFCNSCKSDEIFGWRKAGCPALLLTPDYRELVVKSLTETQHVSYMTPGKHLYSCTSLGDFPQDHKCCSPWKKNSRYATAVNQRNNTVRTHIIFLCFLFCLFVVFHCMYACLFFFFFCYHKLVNKDLYIIATWARAPLSG